MSRVLVTGIAGSLARLVGLSLQREGHEVSGVDYRRRPKDHPERIPYTQANYNKTRIEDLIRRFKPETILHLGRVGNLKLAVGRRFDLNVVGSGKIFELAEKYGVHRVVVLSTFHIYGAHPANHVPIAEDEPLRSGPDFPELSDAVQLDNLALQWAYRNPQLRTMVLRPTNVVGPDIRNAVSNYLRQPTVARVLGFDPMWQFIHQTDMVRAILLAAQSDANGVFNVAGDGTLPLSRALALTGARVLPIPGPIASQLLKAMGRIGPALPPYLVDFCRYPVIINDSPFRAETGFAPTVSIVDAIRSTAGR